MMKYVLLLPFLPLLLLLPLPQAAAAELIVRHWPVHDSNAQLWDTVFGQMQHLTHPDFAAASARALQEQGHTPEDSQRLFRETGIVIDLGKRPQVIFSHSDPKILQPIADCFVGHCIGVTMDKLMAASEEAKRNNDLALYHKLNSTLDDSNNWSSVRPADAADASASATSAPGTATSAPGTATPTAPAATPASLSTPAPPARTTQPQGENRPEPACPPAVHLKHHHDFEDATRLETQTFWQLRQIHTARFRNRCLSLLAEQGFTDPEAAQLLDQTTIRYNTRTRELRLANANADAHQLRTLARAITHTYRFIDIYEAMLRDEQARANNDTAYIERTSTKLDGGDYSNWLLAKDSTEAALPAAPPSSVTTASTAAASATTATTTTTATTATTAQSRWEPPLSFAHLPSHQAVEKAITTDYKVYAPGILIPPGAERAITRDRNTTILSIHSAQYYQFYSPSRAQGEQSNRYDYLVVSVELGTPHGSFESIWHGRLVVRKPVADNHWDNAEVFTPCATFDKKMADFLSDEEIEALLLKP